VNGAIIIVARNNLHLTKSAVRTAMEQDVPCDVLVVDNASTDGTGAWLKTKNCATVTYQDQRSLSECWNRAIKVFWTIGATQCLCLNNDVEIRPDTYRLLASYCTHFVTCVSVNDPAQLGNTGDRTVQDLLKSERSHPDFSAFMISKTVTDRAGWFDESYYPAFYEDNDYHVRMHRAGIKAVCVDLPFLHHGSQTIKTAELGEFERIKRGAGFNKDRFKKKYGCYPATPEYERLFS